jgi:integrase
MSEETSQEAKKKDASPSRRARGDGSIFHKRYTDKRTGRTQKTSTLYIKYYVGGKPVIEPTGTAKYREAVKQLRQRQAEVASGRYVGRDVEKTSYKDIREIALNHYRANDRKSFDRFQDAIAHLDQFFSFRLVRDITPDRVTAYTAARRDEHAANATINRELAALKLMLRLGERAGKVVNRPYVGMLEERNRRTGFFEDEQFEAILTHLSEDLRPVFGTAFVTGWRVKSEILTREKSHLDLKAGWLRLEPGETKNDEGRMFPLLPRLRQILEIQVERTRQIEQETGRIIRWLFHRDGRPIKSFRRAWLTACTKAGLSGRIPHDFRRTAIRNLERAGIARSAAMAMVGHKTESVYRRYAIADERMLTEAGEKLQTLYDSSEARPRSVVPLEEARAGRSPKV